MLGPLEPRTIITTEMLDLMVDGFQFRIKVYEMWILNWLLLWLARFNLWTNDNADFNGNGSSFYSWMKFCETSL